MSPASPATRCAPRCSGCRSSRSARPRPTSGRAAAAGVEAGIAIRLYSEEDFEGRPEFTDPEILRTNLACVILQMASLGLGDIARFPFVEPPDKRNIAAGVQLLEELGALRRRRRPADRARPAAGPAADRPAAGSDDPRGRAARLRARGDRHRRRAVAAGPARAAGRAPQAQADQLHARFKDESSDFLTWLNLWRYLKEQQKELSQQRLPPDVQARVPPLPARPRVAGLRVPAASGLQGDGDRRVNGPEPQSGSAAATTTRRPDDDGIHQALLSGLLSHIGRSRSARRSQRGGPAADAGVRRRPRREVRDLPRAAGCTGRTRSS